MRRLSIGQSALLDFMRGVSALMVLIGHGITMLPYPPPIGTRYAIQSYGVVIFFILSGFLIAHNCMAREGYTFGSYLIDRFARIFTAFVPALVLVALLDPLFLNMTSSSSPQTFVANLLMLHQTPFGRMIPGLPQWEPFGSARQFWTIPIEWWLYVLFGIVFFAKRSIAMERLIMAALFIPAALVVIYFTAGESVGLTWLVAAFAGMALTAMPSDRLRGLAGTAAFAFAVALAYRFTILDAASTFDFFEPVWMLLTTGLVVSLLLLARESNAFERVLVATKPIWTWLAGISYSLYLTHQSLHYLWRSFLPTSRWRWILLMWVCSIAFAWLFTLLFDRHHKQVAKWLKNALRGPQHAAVSSKP